MTDKLTKQEAKFVKKVVETGNLTDSAQQAFDIEDPNYAGVKGHRLIRKAKIVNAIKTLADSIPDELVAEKHLALLKKEEVITKNNMTTGEIDVIPTGQIDVQAVSKGLDMAYKLKGAYAPEKSVNLNIDIDTDNPEAKALADEYEQRLKERM